MHVMQVLQVIQVLQVAGFEGRAVKRSPRELTHLQRE